MVLALEYVLYSNNCSWNNSFYENQHVHVIAKYVGGIAEDYRDYESNFIVLFIS